MAKKKMTPADYMRLSIDEMKKCVQEPRTDGKISPKVGAVLVLPNGEYFTAYRGELRKGNHAEYTAIERKCIDKNLEGATIYATLEPCAPNSRKFPKRGCSKRITDARIKKVYMGIEDPDPTVCGLGRQHLLDNGVEIEMYPEELQAEIIACNEKFLEQAKDRAKYAKEKEEEQQLLTQIESATVDVDIDDLDVDLLNQFKLNCKILGDILSESVVRSFVQLGILAKVKEKVVPTGLGLLLFGKNPQLKYPNAMIRATVNRGGKEDVATFEGPLIKQPEQIEAWIANELTSWISRMKAKREKIYEYPLEAIREIVTNAILHRDYDIEGAPIYVELNENSIVVKSPGYPVRPLTLAQMETFSAPSLSRNPKIIYAFDKFDLAEQRGLGFKTVRALPETNGIPLPKVSYEEPYLKITMPFAYSENTRNDIDASLEKGVDFAKTHSIFSKSDYADGLSLSARTAERQLQQMTQMAIIEKVGSGPNTKYKYKV